MLAQNEDFSENYSEIHKVFTAAGEWLLSDSTTKAFVVQRDEIEISQSGEKLFLSCMTMRGWQTWRVVNWERDGEKLIVETARKLKSNAEQLEFVPRISSQSLQADVNAARLFEANKLAELARKTLSNWAKIKRVSLNRSDARGKVGTLAKILLALPNSKTVAVCGSVVSQTNVASLLSNAVLWFAKLQERRTTNELWLIVDNKSLGELQKLHALLREGWKRQIKLYERVSQDDASCKNTEGTSSEKEFLRVVELLEEKGLSGNKPQKLKRPRSREVSSTAQSILELAPNEIDVVRSKYGETLRYNGLPFVRIREILGEEQVWFGVEAKTRRALDKSSLSDLAGLLEQLRAHRHADAADKRNVLYKSEPESWLESILIRNVSRLDPNLILAPLYAQFRLSNKAGSLDLLALRTDGRLVVIELKTTADREHIFQAASYWQQVELQRRAGFIEKAKLFGDLKIQDSSPLIYLVAPLMSFHHDFDILAHTLTPEIELWRFDLNEDWRTGIRVARRTKHNQ